MTRPSQRREPYGKCEHLPVGQGMAGKAVALRGVSIALACRTFDVSETCYRYIAKLNDENEQIADLLIGLTRAKMTWGFGLCFLYLRTVPGTSLKPQARVPHLPQAGIEPQDQATPSHVGILINHVKDNSSSLTEAARTLLGIGFNTAGAH
jgi:hypothetical protein